MVPPFGVNQMECFVNSLQVWVAEPYPGVEYSFSIVKCRPISRVITYGVKQLLVRSEIGHQVVRVRDVFGRSRRSGIVLRR